MVLRLSFAEPAAEKQASAIHDRNSAAKRLSVRLFFFEFISLFLDLTTSGCK